MPLLYAVGLEAYDISSFNTILDFKESSVNKYNINNQSHLKLSNQRSQDG